MTDLTTPVPAETPVASLGGKLGLMPDAAGNDGLGLAVDSPSPFTLLGRLKAVAAAVTAGASSIVAAITGTLDVSAQSLPLPAGAATDAGLAALHTQLAGTLAFHADALPLPTGAATAARQDSALSANRATAIVPSDTVDLAAIPVGIYVGTGGDLAIVASGDGQGAGPVVWKAVAAGSLIPLRARRIYATGTTAADLLAVYS